MNVLKKVGGYLLILMGGPFTIMAIWDLFFGTDPEPGAGLAAHRLRLPVAGHGWLQLLLC